MLKKERERKQKISMPKGMREKMHAKEHEEKKRKRKKEIRQPILLNKRHPSKKERVMIKGVQKNILGIGRL